MKKKYGWHVTAIVLAATLALFGMGYAGWFGEDKPADKNEAPGMTETQSPDATGEEGLPEGAEIIPEKDQIIVSGRINESSQLVDDNGHTYDLADTDQGAEVKSMVGKKVQIKGAVLEEEGQVSVEVHDYSILE